MRVTSLAIAFWLVIVLHWALQWWIYSLLRRHHFATWQALGAPSLTTVGVRSSFSYMQFVWRGGHRAVANGHLRLLTNTLKTLDVVGSALLIWLLVATVWTAGD
jgi:hypothetical protein